MSERFVSRHGNVKILMRDGRKLTEPEVVEIDTILMAQPDGWAKRKDSDVDGDCGE